MRAPTQGRSRGAADITRAGLESLGEAELLAMAESAPVALFASVDPFGVVLANERMLEITGRPRDEILGDGWLDAVHPDDREAVRIAGATLRTEGHVESEHRFVQPDGTVRWVHVHATRGRDDPEHPTFVGTMIDVTEFKQVEAALRESEGRFRALVEHSFDIISVIEADGAVRYTSPSAERITGSASYEPGESMFERIHPDDVPVALERLSAAGPEPEELTDVRVQHADGHWLTLEAVAVNLLDDPEISAIVVFARDVTHQRATEAKLRSSEERLRDQASILEMIATSIPLPDTLAEICRLVESQVPGSRCTVLLVSEDGRTLHHGAAPTMDPAFTRAIDGLAVAEGSAVCGTAAHRGTTVAVADARVDPACAALLGLMEEHHIAGLWSTPVKASSDGRVLGTFAVYRSEPGLPTADDEAVVESVTQLAAVAIERHEFEARLERQAMHDPLTHLPNRALFAVLLDSALLRAQRAGTAVAVLFLDLDGFKIVNDSLGHSSGDEVLVAVSSRLEEVLRHQQASARPQDVLARFGGDEFTVLCESLDPGEAASQAVHVAERLIDAVRDPVVINGEDQFVSASIGIALAFRGDEDPEALLRDADAAMYRAKAKGRGRYEVFDAEMRSQAQARHETENALHRAVAEGEFTVHYQPLIDLRDGRCTGVEALVRWRNPERGVLEPAEFLDAAEETGLIIPIGEQVLAHATAHAHGWRGAARRGMPFRCSVNLSGRQLVHTGLAEAVAGALGSSGLDPGALCVEITETVLMDDVEAGIAAVKALKELGVQVSIDDFGTGYSALGYLRQFPIDDVKIDRSFVARLGCAPEDTAIVDAVVSLGHALGVTVTAEGVETQAQLAELRSLGVDVAQGFLFAPPIAADELTARLEGDRAWF